MNVENIVVVFVLLFTAYGVISINFGSNTSGLKNVVSHNPSRAVHKEEKYVIGDQWYVPQVETEVIGHKWFVPKLEPDIREQYRLWVENNRALDSIFNHPNPTNISNVTQIREAA